jgi:sigma-B regulation protein RsbU (phosphoserine phosphatase)
VGKEFSPGAFLSWLNERMNFELRSASGLIVTFFAGLLDMKGGFLRYSNAGQTHPIILRQGKAMELPVSGSGLGFASSVAYAEQSVAIKSEDVLSLYTDGLTEPGCVEGCAPVNAVQLFERVPYSADYHRKLLEAALADAGHKDFDDDVTIVTARIL